MPQPREMFVVCRRDYEYNDNTYDLTGNTPHEVYESETEAVLAAHKASIQWIRDNRGVVMQIDQIHYGVSRNTIGAIFGEQAAVEYENQRWSWALPTNVTDDQIETLLLTADVELYTVMRANYVPCSPAPLENHVPQVAGRNIIR